MTTLHQTGITAAEADHLLDLERKHFTDDAAQSRIIELRTERADAAVKDRNADVHLSKRAARKALKTLARFVFLTPSKSEWTLGAFAVAPVDHDATDAEERRTGTDIPFDPDEDRASIVLRDADGQYYLAVPLKNVAPVG